MGRVGRRYQVFVSSTYTDLIEERRQLIQVLLEMDCVPAGMELFQAANEDQWTLIKQVIDDSDYYVVMLAGRYGSRHPDTGVAYTEMEYDYAVAVGKPVFGFLHANPGSISLDKTESETDGRAGLEAFREKIKTRMVRFFTSPEDLGAKVVLALNRAKSQNPAEGWVRGRFAMTPEGATELAELKAEVSDLRLRLEEANRAARVA